MSTIPEVPEWKTKLFALASNCVDRDGEWMADGEKPLLDFVQNLVFSKESETRKDCEKGYFASFENGLNRGRQEMKAHVQDWLIVKDQDLVPEEDLLKYLETL